MDNSNKTDGQFVSSTPIEPTGETTQSNQTAAPAPMAPVAVSDITPETPTVTTPESPASTSEPLASETVAPKSQKPKKMILVLVALLLLGLLAGGAGGYLFGSNKDKSALAAAKYKITTLQDKPLAIPQGATVIAQCSKGRGTQYALPKDIPLGPVYNVYEGKVIGIEFMVGKDDLLTGSKNFLNLQLGSVKYDHVNIGLLSQGHAGFPLPHYHVDIMTVPTSITDKITCK